jgi:SSS family solute:Na+ symporter
VLAIGLPTAVYTMFGGVQAVTWTDVKQMGVIVAGVAAAVVVLVMKLPEEVSLISALHIAGSTGRMQALDFRLDLTETYTFWSGLIGGLFLMLSYFGCDQSQVQRYLTARSIDEGRRSLMMSAYVKIPLQVLILFVGVLVFVFYLFAPPPMLFNPQHDGRVRASAEEARYADLQDRFNKAHQERTRSALEVVAARQGGDAASVDRALREFQSSEAAVTRIRGDAAALVSSVTGDPYRDVNYVFPTFVTTEMPIGLVGLMIAAIFAAAMSSISAELNALSAATVIDFYRRHVRVDASDRHYLLASRWATAVWGGVACVVAVYATTLGSLIEVVNRFGSFLYGSLLGVFVLAIGTQRATGLGAFVGLIAGMSAVAYVAFWHPAISFLWHNVVGVAVVVFVGLLVSRAGGVRRGSERGQT